VRIAGYAALFRVVDGAGDTIRPGAFARALAEGGALPLLWQHDPRQRIGFVERVAEDERGLRVVARVDNLASRAASLLRARAVSGLSFGYRARGYRRAEVGRVLEDIDLFEVSLVTRPLQHGARVHLVA
jgi:HK97 family phage prohead protease